MSEIIIQWEKLHKHATLVNKCRITKQIVSTKPNWLNTKPVVQLKWKEDKRSKETGEQFF